MEFKEFTKEQFIDTVEPYAWAHEYASNELQLTIALKNLEKQAKKFEISGIKMFYNSYVKDISRNNGDNTFFGNITAYAGCSVALCTGEWIADDDGVYRMDRFGDEQIACNTPITIIEKLRNIDTGLMKVKIGYTDNRTGWKETIVPRGVIASSNKILELAEKGIGVTSETSKNLVNFLADLEKINRNDIPERKCCSRLGWVEDNKFAPYTDGIEFDGDPNLSHVFAAVKKEGSFDIWKKEIIKNCKFNYINKIVLAASFAAPLIKLLGINNFFLHLWADTETAKTVSIICAASVWANPRIGKYISTFNSTNVGKEKIAEIANSIPVFFDELEIATDRISFDKEIYELSEGAGRLRGAKAGGTDKTGTWNTCFITTGEKPIISENSKGGAVNRIIEVHCIEKLIENGKDTCEVMFKNYGHAGEMFIKTIQKNKEKINDIYKDFYKQLESSLKTEKQTSIGAILCTALNLASIEIFDGKLFLDIDEVAKFLNSKEQMSVHQRAYDFMMSFISRNSKRFMTKDNNGEIFGKIDIEETTCYLDKTIFDKMCNESGFNPTSFLYWLSTNSKLAKKGKDRYTVSTRINGIRTWCVAVQFEGYGEEEKRE